MQQARQTRKQQEVRAGFRVIGRGGDKLGAVEQPIHAEDSGELTAFTMRCGLLRRSFKLIPAETIKEVNAGSETVIVRLAKKDLRDMLNANPAAGAPLPVEVSLPRQSSKVFEDGELRVNED